MCDSHYISIKQHWYRDFSRVQRAVDEFTVCLRLLYREETSAQEKLDIKVNTIPSPIQSLATPS